MKSATDILSNNLNPGIISTSIDSDEMKIIHSPKISIVIPCYNEEKTIGSVIDLINQLCLPSYEIIVIDDGSKDNSVNIIRSKPNTKLYIHQNNMGYGKTLIDGISKSLGNYIITIDSDGQHDPRDIPNLIKILEDENADIVVGSRYLGKYNYPIPFINRVGEAFIEIIFYILYGRSVKNNQGGMRVFRKHTIDILDNLKFQGMAFTTEILMKGLNKGFKIVEGPIHLYFRPVGVSRVKRVRLLFDVFECFLVYTYYRLKNLKK